MLAADCVKPKAAAASVTLPKFATATKISYCRRVTLIISIYLKKLININTFPSQKKAAIANNNK